MRFPRNYALLCICSGWIPRMTRLQLRCVFSFGVPLALLVVFFAVHYYLLFNDEISLGIKCTITGLELLYAWNPCLGGYSSYTSPRARDLAYLSRFNLFNHNWKFEKTKGWLRFRIEIESGFVLSHSRIRFWAFQGVALVLLLALTLFRVLIRFYFTDCPWCWETGIALKADWLYLQGATIACWIAANWKDETNALKKSQTEDNGPHFLQNSKIDKLSRNQKICVFLFILPFSILVLVSSVLLWAELNSWSKPTINFISFFEDLLFILGQVVAFLTWVSNNWNREREIAKNRKRIGERYELP